MKLTIGIPTYNSRDYLNEAVDKVLDQIKNTADVELLICDNHSDDGSDRLIAGYCEQFPDKVRQVRHPANVGMDANFWSVITNARGEYVHLHADGDYYVAGAVARVLEKLFVHELDVLVLSNNYLNTWNGSILRNADTLTDDVLCIYHGETFFCMKI